MKYNIRPYQDSEQDQIIAVTLRAFVPIFDSFEQVLGEEIFPLQYPDWRKTQEELAIDVTTKPDKFTILVGEVEGRVAGYLVYTLDQKELVGEIYLLAVDPGQQNEGLGTALNLAALEAFREAGMKLASVGTGGDDGHAPARRSYEKAGFRPLPLVRYYQAL